MFQQIVDLTKQRIVDINIIFLSDLHIGLNGFREDVFDELLKELDDPNTYWIGGGDYVEGRNPKAKYFDYDENTMSVQEQYDHFFEKIAPYKDKCLGLHVGNHERALIKEATLDPLRSYCLQNGIPYLGNGTALTTIKRGNKKYTICTLHGAGGGSKVGGNVNKVYDYLMNFEADTVICGHYHRLSHTVGTKPYVDEFGKQRWKYTNIVLSGSMLEGYSEKGAGYAEQMMLPPLCIGWARIKLDKDLKETITLRPYV